MSNSNFTETLSELELRAAEPNWVAALTDVDAERAAQLLTDADDLRFGGLSDQRTALACYEGLARHIDPATAAGVDRMRWIVREAPELTPGLEPLLRRMAESLPHQELRREAAIAVGTCFLLDGESGRAEAYLRRQLAIVRGTGRIAEYAAALRLTHVFTCQHRIFECLVLGRRVVELAQALRPAVDQAAAWNRLAYGLLSIDAWDEIEHAIASMEKLLPLVAPNHRQRVAVWIAAVRANRALQQNDYDEALDQLDFIEVSIDATEGGPRALRPIHAWRGDVLWQAGRPQAATHELERALETTPTDDVVAFRARHLLACCRVSLGDLPGARLLAVASLERLRSGLETEFGTGTLIQLGSRLGEVLTSCGELEQARTAYDLAGHSAVQRLVELDECVQALPELSTDEEHDRRLLAEIRALHINAHRELLESVARVFERAIVAGEPWARNLLDADGQVQLCAWCHRYRTSRGVWVPGGQYLAAHPRGRLTHGMCPDCFGDSGPRLRLRRVD